MRPIPESVRQRYALLPEVVRSNITIGEFMWLSDTEKDRLLDDLTTPDREEEY